MRRNHNINQTIKDKINEIDDKNMRDFLLKSLEYEYDVQDQDKPKVIDPYTKLINKYGSD